MQSMDDLWELRKQSGISQRNASGGVLSTKSTIEHYSCLSIESFIDDDLFHIDLLDMMTLRLCFHLNTPAGYSTPLCRS